MTLSTANYESLVWREIGTSFLFLLIFLPIHPHTIIPWNMIMVFTCSNNVLLNLKKYSQYSFILCGDLYARTSCSQPLMECVTAFKCVEDLNSSSFYEMQGLYSRRSEDNVVNGYGRSLLEMCAAFELIILNSMCSSDPKGSFTFVSP